MLKIRDKGILSFEFVPQHTHTQRRLKRRWRLSVQFESIHSSYDAVTRSDTPGQTWHVWTNERSEFEWRRIIKGDFLFIMKTHKKFFSLLFFDLPPESVYCNDILIRCFLQSFLWNFHCFFSKFNSFNEQHDAVWSGSWDKTGECFEGQFWWIASLCWHDMQNDLRNYILQKLTN